MRVHRTETIQLIRGTPELERRGLLPAHQHRIDHAPDALKAARAILDVWPALRLVVVMSMSAIVLCYRNVSRDAGLAPSVGQDDLLAQVASASNAPDRIELVLPRRKVPEPPPSPPEPAHVPLQASRMARVRVRAVR